MPVIRYWRSDAEFTPTAEVPALDDGGGWPLLRTAAAVAAAAVASSAGVAHAQANWPQDEIHVTADEGAWLPRAQQGRAPPPRVFLDDGDLPIQAVGPPVEDYWWRPQFSPPAVNPPRVFLGASEDIFVAPTLGVDDSDSYRVVVIPPRKWPVHHLRLWFNEGADEWPVPVIPPPPPLEHGVQALGSARYTPGMRFRGKTLVSRFKKRRNE
jgi:hypothetical protein